MLCCYDSYYSIVDCPLLFEQLKLEYLSHIIDNCSSFIRFFIYILLYC